MYAARSRSFMVNVPFGFLLVRMCDRMMVLNFIRHTCHSLEGLYHTPPMPVRDASVVSIHVGGCGLFF